MNCLDKHFDIAGGLMNQIISGNDFYEFMLRS